MRDKQTTVSIYSDFLMAFIINRPGARLLPVAHFASHGILSHSAPIVTLTGLEA